MLFNLELLQGFIILLMFFGIGTIGLIVAMVAAEFKENEK